MSVQFFSYLLIALCVVALAIGQIIFKLVGSRITGITDLFTDLGAAALLGTAIGLYGASTLRHGYFPHQLQPDEVFDAIVFNDVLEHIPDLMGTLEACVTHLRPGGLLVLNCPNRLGVFYRIADLLDRIGLHEPFDRMWQRDVQSPHVWYFKPNDLRHLGEQQGLVWAQTLDLLPITLQGILYRIFYVRNQSVFMGAIALLGTLLLMPLLAILPRDISVVILRKVK